MKKNIEIQKKLMEAELRKNAGEKPVNSKIVFARLRKRLKLKEKKALRPETIPDRIIRGQG